MPAQNKQFQKTFKGYNPQEVDEYIEFILEKYTEAYRENNELERKLRIVVTNLDEIKDEEESIRSTLISAQKMAEKIIADANERADIITEAVKDRCDGVIAEFRQQLQAEKEKAWMIRTAIIDFKKTVYELYGKHIEELKNLSVNEIEDIVLPNDDAIVSNIFNDVRVKMEEEAERRRIEESTLKTEEPPHIEEDDEPVPAEEDTAEDEQKAEPETTEEAGEQKPVDDEYVKYLMEDDDKD